MTQKALTNPKVFVSYSWTSPEHEEWVVDLATRLFHDGIEVVLDKWDLKEGQEVFAFMERMVTSEEIDKVLIICDKGYKEKADNRAGGVGVETQIITPHVYNNMKQEKFIPIVAERDENGGHFIPSYIASRLYIDLSSPDIFEENYEKLIRNIYEVPLYKKPSLGSPPSYLFEENVQHFETAIIVRKMKSVIDKSPQRLKYIANEFVTKFCKSLEYFNIEKVDKPNELDELIVEKIDKMLPLRDDYISVLEMLCEVEKIDAEFVTEFFENIYAFTEFRKDGQYYEQQMDHYKFLITELFLYTIAILLNHRMYLLVSQLLTSEYYIESKYTSDSPIDFRGFRFYLDSLENRNRRLKLNRVSVHADLIIKRLHERYKKDIVETDILLYYLSKILDKNKWGWFPTTYVYTSYYRTIKLLSRLKSRSHFEATKCLFNIDNISQLQTIIRELETDRGQNRWERILRITNFINPDEIGMAP